MHLGVALVREYGVPEGRAYGAFTYSTYGEIDGKTHRIYGGSSPLYVVNIPRGCWINQGAYGAQRTDATTRRRANACTPRNGSVWQNGVRTQFVKKDFKVMTCTDII